MMRILCGNAQASLAPTSDAYIGRAEAEQQPHAHRRHPGFILDDLRTRVAIILVEQSRLPETREAGSESG